MHHLIRMIVAYILALPIGWERERSTHIMGIRTFPLVSIASCGFILVGSFIAKGDPEAETRIIQGLMTGLGFIGGGAILKEGHWVRGTATAVSVWTTGIVGAAVGHGRYEIAILLSIINFVTLSISKRERDPGRDLDNEDSDKR